MVSWAMAFGTIPFLSFIAMLKHAFRAPGSSATWRTISIAYLLLLVVVVVNYGSMLFQKLTSSP